MSVLSTSTRLFCIFAVDVRSLSNSLFVSNLRCAYISLYLELTEKTVNDDLQMKLTHTGDDRLSCLRICMSTECRVFFCKFCKRFTKFTLGCLCLRLDCELDNRIRELHGLKDYRMLLVTDRITCCGDLESDRCSDISGVYLIQLCTVVCVHLKDTSDTFFLILCCIQYIRTGVHCTGVNPEVSQLTYERVCHDLEYESGERLIIR